MSFLFTGTVEQSYIAHAMAYSACIGAYKTEECRNNRGPYETQSSTTTPSNSNALFLSILIFICYSSFA